MFKECKAKHLIQSYSKFVLKPILYYYHYQFWTILKVVIWEISQQFLIIVFQKATTIIATFNEDYGNFF